MSFDIDNFDLDNLEQGVVNNLQVIYNRVWDGAEDNSQTNEKYGASNIKFESKSGHYAPKELLSITYHSTLATGLQSPYYIVDMYLDPSLNAVKNDSRNSMTVKITIKPVTAQARPATRAMHDTTILSNTSPVSK